MTRMFWSQPAARICMHRKKINISTVMAGQRLGVKEVEDGIWLVSFMKYDLRYIDLEQKTLQTIDNPFGTRLSPVRLSSAGPETILPPDSNLETGIAMRGKPLSNYPDIVSCRPCPNVASKGQ
jgi:hypothetical protein